MRETIGETTPPIRTSESLGRCAKQWCGVNINSCRSCQRCSGLFELLRGRYCTAALHGEIKLRVDATRAVPLINVLREVSEPIKSKTTSMPDPKVDKRFVHNTHSAIFAGGEARRGAWHVARCARRECGGCDKPDPHEANDLIDPTAAVALDIIGEGAVVAPVKVAIAKPTAAMPSHRHPGFLRFFLITYTTDQSSNPRCSRTPGPVRPVAYGRQCHQ